MGFWFQLPTSTSILHCYAAGNYYPYRINGERNPLFNAHCRHILSSKGPGEQNHGAAIKYFTELLIPAVSSWNLKGMLPPGIDHNINSGKGIADVMVVPSSKANKTSSGILDIMVKVCAKDARLNMQPNALVRTKEIQKLAKGGNRDISVHLNSISYKPKRHANLVILVDDVCTSGNSMIACHDLIKKESPLTNIIGLAFGRTAYA